MATRICCATVLNDRIYICCKRTGHSTTVCRSTTAARTATIAAFTAGKTDNNTANDKKDTFFHNKYLSVGCSSRIGLSRRKVAANDIFLAMSLKKPVSFFDRL